MVQQGEAQNNDCLFVVVLLAVIIAPPPLKDASYAQASMPAHTCTHLHTHRNATRLLQTHMQPYASPGNDNFNMRLSRDLWWSPKQTVKDTRESFLKRWDAHMPTHCAYSSATLYEDSSISILVSWKLWQQKPNTFFLLFYSVSDDWINIRILKFQSLLCSSHCNQGSFWFNSHSPGIKTASWSVH